MKKIKMNLILLMLFLTCSNSSFAWDWTPIKSRHQNFCHDELEDLLRKKFGAEVVVQSIAAYGADQDWLLWATTNLCQGQVVAKFMGTVGDCKKTAYFHRPRMMYWAYGHSGECEKLIPTIYW